MNTLACDVAIENASCDIRGCFSAGMKLYSHAFPLWIEGRIITSRPGNVTSPGRRTACAAGLQEKHTTV